MAYNPKSKENLQGPRFGRIPGAATEAANISNARQKSQREQEQIVDKYMSDLVDMAFGQSSPEEFMQKAESAPNQALRVVALNLANPKTDMATLQWLIERIKGKPKQTTENVTDTTLHVEKPVLVFGNTEEDV